MAVKSTNNTNKINKEDELQLRRPVLKDNMKIIILSFVSIVLVGLIIFASITLKKVYDEENKPEEIRIYALVKSKENKYVVLEDIDTSKAYIINKNMNVNVGDLLSVTYEEEIDDCDYQVIASSKDYDINIPNTTEVVVTEVTQTTTKPTTTVKPSTKPTVSKTTQIVKTTAKTTAKTTTNKQQTPDDIVLGYVNTESQKADNANSKNLKETLKDSFITLVDFIFYNGTIKGVTFNQLSNSAKAKVIYVALKIDGKIDEYWPGYKEKISNKMQDIKSRLLAKYLDLTSAVCAKYPHECEELRSNFDELKRNFKFSWDTILGGLKYAYNKGASTVKDWYEIFSGKKTA